MQEIQLCITGINDILKYMKFDFSFLFWGEIIIQRITVFTVFVLISITYLIQKILLTSNN